MDEITVSELCREAAVNRTTFYKYYSLPSDVVVEAVREIAAESDLIHPAEGQPLYDVMLHITNTFYENRTLMRLYYRANGNLMPILYHAVAQAMENAAFMHKTENYFLAGGVGGVAAYWMQHDFKDSPEKIAELLTRYISKFI